MREEMIILTLASRSPAADHIQGGWDPTHHSERITARLWTVASA